MNKSIEEALSEIDVILYFGQWLVGRRSVFCKFKSHYVNIAISLLAYVPLHHIMSKYKILYLRYHRVFCVGVGGLTSECCYTEIFYGGQCLDKFFYLIK